MSLSAVILASDMRAANDMLKTQFGPGPNFSIPTYAGPRSNYAALHALAVDSAFYDAVKALPGVQWSEIAGTPQDRVADALSKLPEAASWGGNAPLLQGQVTAGLHRDPDAPDGALWYVVTPFDRDIYSDPLDQLPPALIRRARIPGVVYEWVQPLDQFDAFLTKNPFTQEPDRVTYNGATWDCTNGSAGGPDGSLINTFAPGVFGWTEVTP